MRRLTLLDKIRLRQSSVYRDPKEIAPLQIPYGDLTGTRIRCSQIDKAGKVFHASDIPIQAITAVYEEGKQVKSGVVTKTAYMDETGRSIAAVVFDSPRLSGGISISCKGVMKDTGELIENPADILRHLFLEVQGYDPDSIDLPELARFYSDCMKEEIRAACVISEVRPIREFLDEFARNINASWMISDGKSVMRLKWF